ncbi:Egl nine-like 3 isoform x1, partial [Globisporangium splendens]
MVSSGNAEDTRAVPLPAIGTRGVRNLDGLAFACHVVAHDTRTNTITIQYSDDQQLEVGVLPEEFIFTEGDDSNSDEPRDELEDYAEDCFRLLYDALTPSAKIQSDSETAGSLFMHAMSFLDHFQWIQSLVYVSRRWRRHLLQQKSWQTVYLPPRIVSSGSGGVMSSEVYAPSIYRMISRVELLSSSISSSISDETPLPMQPNRALDTAKACEVIERVVFDGYPICDDQVLQIVRCCRSLKSISLHRCNHVSFLLLYELTRLVKKQQQQDSSVSSLESVDVWLCRGISPAYVDQLQSAGACATRSRLEIYGPGFFIVEVSSETDKWITSEATQLPMSTKTDHNNGATIQCQKLSIRFAPKETLRNLFASQQHDRICKQLKNLNDHLKQLPFAMVPFVDLNEILAGTAREQTSDRWQQYSLIGFPWSLEDLTQLVKQYESRDVQAQLHALTSSIMEQPLNPEESRDDANGSRTDQESLGTRAENVFAMLRQSATDLESQIARLEQQVHKMTLAKEQAQQEYLHAQFALDQVAKEADRALLSLAAGTDASAVPPPPPPALIFTDDVTNFGKDGDELLPPLPSNDKLQTLGSRLQSDGFAVLDQFVGSLLSHDVRDEVEQLYLSYASKRTTLDSEGSDLEKAPEFKLGELAGGNTGRNLRYKMEHVRGDYMLWVDENDTFCPPSLRLMLRQMDRLVLERLPAWSLELGHSSLLRKKAMVTCYPGNGARYTKHCGNPNKDGRKLTAILYLNADWQPEHGGELQLHLPKTPKENDHKIAPIMDRLLLFFSDRRVPHEVLPCYGRNRFALTVWYLDYDEFMNAQVFGTMLQDQQEEETHIQQEIGAFASNQREL